MVLWILLAGLRFRVRGSYPLWPVFPNSSTNALQYRVQSATPKVLLPLVWPLSISLAAT